MKQLRLDRESAYMDDRLRRCVRKHDIFLDLVARDAHNEKGTMIQIALDSDPEDAPEKIFTHVLDAMNDLGRYRGHSPFMMMLGRTPEMGTATLFGGGENIALMGKLAGEDDDNKEEQNDAAFHQHQRLRTMAHTAFLEVDANRNLARLQVAKARKRLIIQSAT